MHIFICYKIDYSHNRCCCPLSDEYIEDPILNHMICKIIQGYRLAIGQKPFCMIILGSPYI